jgi:hypothetical protein
MAAISPIVRSAPPRRAPVSNFSSIGISLAS